MSIPVLMYHHVLPTAGYITSTVDQFERQMRFLAEKNYYTLTAQQFYDFKMGMFVPPAKAVLITFDDGWRNNFVYAYPILKRYNLKATLFIVTEWIEQASQKKALFEPLPHEECIQRLRSQPHAVCLSWSDIEQMRDHFDVHPHTHTHREGLFSNLAWSEEFAACRDILKERLGIGSTQICWPRGKFDSQLQLEAMRWGFDCFYTTMRGVNLSDGDLTAIRRIAAKSGDSWLDKTLQIFSSPLLGKLYSHIKP